jgi:peptidoglycan biosynthesis protein MviN/MurJ (putative lipid II flippase)
MTVVAISPAAGAVLYAFGETRPVTAVSVLAGALAVGGFMFAASRFGLVGTALVRCCAQAGGAIVFLLLAARRLETEVPLGRVARAALASAAAGLAATAVSTWLGISWPSVIAGTSAGVVVYVLAAARLRPLERADAVQLEPLVHKMPVLLRGPALALIRSVAE